MRGSHEAAYVLVAGTAVLVTFLFPAPGSAASPAVRYASPSGVGGACTKVAPCGLVTAVNDAPADSTIVIEPGSYGSAEHPLETTLIDNAADLAIRGQTGSKMPVIHSAASGDAVELTRGSTLSAVEIVASSGAYGVDDTTSADHVFVIDTAQSGIACAVYGTLSDSLCVATGSDGTAIGLTVTALTRTTLDGVTAEAPGVNGNGLVATTETAVPFAVSGDNDIAHGGNFDISAINGGGPVTVSLNHSDFSNSLASGTATVTYDPTNIATSPIFVNPAKENFRETGRSPTVNAGAADAAGETDLAGLPRSLGGAPDMGAYEYAKPPIVHRLRVTMHTKHTLHVSVTVDPEGTATTVDLVWTRGEHHHTSRTHSAGHGVAAKVVDFVLRALRANTKYRIHAVCVNAGGRTTSMPRATRTK